MHYSLCFELSRFRSLALAMIVYLNRNWLVLFMIWSVGGLFISSSGSIDVFMLAVQVIRELSGVILTRGPKLCNFVEWRGYKVVYRR